MNIVELSLRCIFFQDEPLVSPSQNISQDSILKELLRIEWHNSGKPLERMSAHRYLFFLIIHENLW